MSTASRLGKQGLAHLNVNLISYENMTAVPGSSMSQSSSAALEPPSDKFNIHIQHPHSASTFCVHSDVYIQMLRNVGSVSTQFLLRRGDGFDWCNTAFAETLGVFQCCLQHGLATCIEIWEHRSHPSHAQCILHLPKLCTCYTPCHLTQYDSYVHHIYIYTRSMSYICHPQFISTHHI